MIIRIVNVLKTSMVSDSIANIQNKVRIDVTPYRIYACSYNSTKSNRLALPDRIHLYKCDKCSYSTIWSRGLAVHKGEVSL